MENNTGFFKAVKAKQKEIKTMTDDDLMKLHDRIATSELQAERKRATITAPDPVFSTAIDFEVRRRYVASGWFWRRWLKPYEYRKWLQHVNRHNEIAKEIMQEAISRELSS
jgi:hypothetical protein